MSGNWLPVLLFGVAGFLGGGAFSMWKKSRGFAVILSLAAALAVVGAVAWLAG